MEIEDPGASLRPPSLVVYVDAPLDELVRRVGARDRPAESAVSAEYLAELQALYEPFLARWSTSPVLRVDSTSVDARTPDGRSELVELVAAELAAGPAA